MSQTPRAALRRALRWGLVTSVLAVGLFLLPPAARAQTCDDCNNEYTSCAGSCDWQYYDCSGSGWWGCDQQRHDCYNQCDSTLNSCLSVCDPGGGGGEPGGGVPDHGHAWCDGWDHKGDCAFNHIGVAGGAEFRRFGGGGGYNGQSFLTRFSSEFNGFGRFTVADGNVGLISTSPLQGQVALHRWSTQRGFYYSIYFTNHGNDYVYGGVAGYVWPPGTNLGFPLYQFFNPSYGHYYTNFPREINCQPGSNWTNQGIMAHVNWPAPFSQAFRPCTVVISAPAPCDPFQAQACRNSGRFFNPGNCTCF